MKKAFSILAFIISSTAFAGFTWIWWQHRDMPYNEAGRYFDGLVVYHEQGVMIYALLSVFFLIAMLTLWYLVWRKT